MGRYKEELKLPAGHPSRMWAVSATPAMGQRHGRALLL
jgi:hypothetical protein